MSIQESPVSVGLCFIDSYECLADKWVQDKGNFCGFHNHMDALSVGQTRR